MNDDVDGLIDKLLYEEIHSIYTQSIIVEIEYVHVHTYIEIVWQILIE